MKSKTQTAGWKIRAMLVVIPPVFQGLMPGSDWIGPFVIAVFFALLSLVFVLGDFKVFREGPFKFWSAPLEYMNHRVRDQDLAVARILGYGVGGGVLAVLVRLFMV